MFLSIFFWVTLLVLGQWYAGHGTYEVTLKYMNKFDHYQTTANLNKTQAMLKILDSNIVNTPSLLPPTSWN